MSNEQHAEWLKEGVESWNRRRKKVRFFPDLSGVKFFDFLPPDFRDAPKTSRYFEKIDLSDADISNADLSGLNFFRAKFSRADISDSNLSMSNFEQSDFSNANLSRVDARLSIFSKCQFESTTLEGIELEGSVFDGAYFIAIDIPENQTRKIDLAKASVFNDRSAYLKFRREISTPPHSVGRNRAGLEFSESGRNKTKKVMYDVFFATNRNSIIQRGEIVDFGCDRVSKLHYGVCGVVIPEKRRVGSLGSPLWKRLFNLNDDRINLEHIISLNRELFWKLIRDTGEKMKVREHPTIFIHGFNTTFKDAVTRTAQIGYDLQIGQGVGLFSWPSNGNFLKYSADESASESSKYLLADFIEDFASKSPKGKINLIAHSMGCRCLTGALEILSNGRTSTLKKINQIIMAAADVDAGIMENQGASAIKNCTRFTSYASHLDNALKISSWLHGYPRVGISPPPFVLQGMDTIIVNDSNLGSFSHGYISSSRIILSDIFSILENNSPPHRRHAIEAVSGETSNLWRIMD